MSELVRVNPDTREFAPKGMCWVRMGEALEVPREEDGTYPDFWRSPDRRHTVSGANRWILVHCRG